MTTCEWRIERDALTEDSLDDSLDDAPRINDDFFADVDHPAQQTHDNVKDVAQCG